MTVNLQDAIKRAGYNFIPEITSPDGEIYGFPYLQMAKNNEYPGMFMYYKPWADKLGLTPPTTTEEMRSYLRTIVTSDPNGNGLADEIGINGSFRTIIGGDVSRSWFNYLMNAFLYVPSDLFDLNNGIISPVFTTDAWREGLKYIRSLVAEGFIPTEVLTQDNTQYNTLLNAVPVRVAMAPWTATRITNPAIDEYVSTPPLKRANGVQSATFVPYPASISATISSRCREPEAAFRVLEYMLKEDISITSRYGKQGSDWDYARDIPNVTSRFVAMMPGYNLHVVAYDDAAVWNSPLVIDSSWRTKGPYVISYEVNSGLGIPLESRVGVYYNRSIAWDMYANGNFGPKEYLSKLIYTIPELDSINDPRTTMYSHILEMTATFLAGNRDIDAGWNAYVAELNTIGLPRIMSTMQTVYNRMYR